MTLLELLFWVLFFVVFYTYLGYGLLLFILVNLKRLFTRPSASGNNQKELPNITLFIPAYNEKDYVEQKMDNSIGLNYPKEKLTIVWVTDGSNDGTNTLLESFDGIKLFHRDQR